MFDHVLALLVVLRSGEDGQTAIEYSLVLLLVAIVLVTALALGLTGALDTTITSIKAAI